MPIRSMFKITRSMIKVIKPVKPVKPVKIFKSTINNILKDVKKANKDLSETKSVNWLLK